jgi:vitamin B12 transporter
MNRVKGLRRAVAVACFWVVQANAAEPDEWTKLPVPATSEGKEGASERDTPVSPSPVSGAAEVVVTATRTEEVRARVGSSITVVSGESLEERKPSELVDVLRGLPGVDVVSSGGPGGNAAVFLRGASAEHTLVLIDGIEANDPISPGRSFNFGTLTPENIERIEVLRGPQSMLYGSDALGGVINIITKRGEGPATGSVFFEGGSYRSFTERAEMSGSVGPNDGGLSYSVGLNRRDVASISAASPSYGNKENDGLGNTGVSSRIGVTPIEGISFNHILRFNDAKVDIDNNGGVGGDDPNRKFTSEDLLTRLESVANLLDGRSTTTVGVSYSDRDVRDDNDPDPAHPTDVLRSSYEGSALKFDLVSSYKVGHESSLLFGLETEREEGASTYRSDGAFGPFTADFSEQDTRTNGYYGQTILGIAPGLFTTVGARIDDNSNFGTETTWRVAPAYEVKDTGTRLSASLGTGFKAPSLYQLYSQYGRPSLQPEESLGWDAGVEQRFWGERASLGLTYFRNRFDNLITFDSATFVYDNISEAKTQGVEVSARFRPADSVTLGATYTYTDAEDETTGQPLLRRPRNKGSVDITYRPCEPVSFTLGTVFVGSRTDTDYSSASPVRKTLGSYPLVNLTAAYAVSQQLELFTRVENLFDKDYEEVLGYGTEGFSAFGGVKLSF